MRRLILSWLALTLSAVIVFAAAETYTLNDGSTVTGEIGTSSCNQDGLLLKQGAGYGGKRVAWSKFTQDSLRKLVEVKEAAKYIEHLVEPPTEERVRERKVSVAKIDIKPVERLQRPMGGSAILGFLKNPVCLLFLVLIYGANVYAGYEVAIFKNRPAAVVCGIAAAAPVIGLGVMALIPAAPVKTQEERQAEELAENAPAVEEAAAAEATEAAPLEAVPTGPVLPPTISFLRGQTTFNRRFFETKFAPYFRPALGEAEVDMRLVLLTHRGDYVGTRFSKIGPAEIYLQVPKGDAYTEIMIPFNDIREVHLKHKDA